MSATDSCIDAATTVAAPTSDIPTINALAVVAVRRRLRTKFRLANTPPGRINRVNGRAITATTGRITTGARTSIAAVTPTAPSPSSAPASEPALAQAAITRL